MAYFFTGEQNNLPGFTRISYGNAWPHVNVYLSMPVKDEKTNNENNRFGIFVPEFTLKPEVKSEAEQNVDVERIKLWFGLELGQIVTSQQCASEIRALAKLVQESESSPDPQKNYIFTDADCIVPILLLVGISLANSGNIQDIDPHSYIASSSSSKCQRYLKGEIQKRRVAILNGLLAMVKRAPGKYSDAMINNVGLLYRLAMEIIYHYIINHTFVFPHGGGVKHKPSNQRMSHTAGEIVKLIEKVKDNDSLTGNELRKAFTKISSKITQAQAKSPSFKLFCMQLHFRHKTTEKLYSQLQQFILNFETRRPATKEEACEATSEARPELPKDITEHVITSFF
jgi:hypothetical protein